MAQTLQKMIFNDQNDFTHVLVAHYCKLEYSNIFLRCVNDIDQELKVKSSKLKVAILTTYNFKLITLKNLRRLWRWGPPLPIPNRAVKTTSADGTRVKPGRVSRCPNFIIKPRRNTRLFLLPATPCSPFVSRKDFLSAYITADQRHIPISTKAPQ